MASEVYFGNATMQTWIKAPQSGMKADSQGWISEQQLLSGRTSIKRSGASHRRFEMNWFGPLNSEGLNTSLHTIKDFADGVYGDGPFFWNDPFAMKSNMFSPAWATPWLSVASDYKPIFSESLTIGQAYINTSDIAEFVGANTKAYPPTSARYVEEGTDTMESEKFTFYIPAGYTLWLGFHGSVSASGGAYYIPYLDGSDGAPVKITPLGVNSSNRVNAHISSTTADKVDFYFAKTEADPCTFYISGLIAQLLPTNVSPDTGNFLAGRGTTGLEFTSFPQVEYYSANISDGQIGLSLSMAEV